MKIATPQQVQRWVTTDGRMHEDHGAATEHEKCLAVINRLKASGLNPKGIGMSDGPGTNFYVVIQQIVRNFELVERAAPATPGLDD